MRSARSLSIVAAIVLVLVAAVPVEATSFQHRFRATITEDYASLGCPAPVSIDAFTCGTAKTKGLGKATVETQLTDFYWDGGDCFVDLHRSTLTFKHRGTLIVDINGTLCPTDDLGNFVLDGTYSIAGGTGPFDRASGHGSVHALRANGPVIEDLVGSIALTCGIWGDDD